MTKLLVINRRQSTIDYAKRIISAKKLIAASIWQTAHRQTRHLKACYTAMHSALQYKLTIVNPSSIPQALIVAPDRTRPSVGLVFGVDDQMCGGLPTSILTAVSAGSHDQLYVLGTKTAQALSATYCGPLSSKFSVLADLATHLCADLAAGRIGSIDALVLQHRKPVWKELLPLVDAPSAPDSADIDPDDNALDAMPALLLALRLYWQSNLTCAQENLERIISTDQSIKNCDQLLVDLKSLRNKVRQEAITQELNEIVAGFVQ